MQLHVDGYGAAQRSLSWRSIVFGVIGSLAGLWGGFWTFVFVAHWAGTPDIRKDLGLEILGSIIIGIAPAAAGAYMLWRAVRAYTRLRRLRRLAAAAWAGVPLLREHLAGALRLSAGQVDALIIDAVELGAPSTPALRRLSPRPAARAGDAPARARDRCWRPPCLPLPAGAAARWALPEAADAWALDDGTGGVRRRGRRFVSERRRRGPRRPPAAASARRTELGSYGSPASWRRRDGRRVCRRAPPHVAHTPSRCCTSIGGPRPRAPALRARGARGRRIGHPGIAAVHDFDTTADGVTFLVMELLHGETLEQRLERVGTLPWPAALAVTSDVGSALQAAHAAGFLHRDLKPSNVFFARGAAAGAERTVLLDFGLAKPLDAGASRVPVPAPPPARLATGRPSRRGPSRSTGAPTSTGWRRCSSRWSPARPPSTTSTWPRSTRACWVSPRRRRAGWLHAHRRSTRSWRGRWRKCRPSDSPTWVRSS